MFRVHTCEHRWKVSNYNKHCATGQQTPFFFGQSHWDSRETKYITVSLRARLRGKGTKVHEVPHFPQPKDSKAHRIRKRVKIAARKERQDTEKRDKILHVHAHENEEFSCGVLVFTV